MNKVLLSDFIDKIGDGIHGTPIYAENGTYYFINGNNLKNGHIVIDTNTLMISDNEYENIKRPLNDNTILISINGTIGNLAYYNDEKIALGKSACYINVKPTENKYYIHYVLSTKEFHKYALQVAHGSTIKNLAPSQIAEYSFLSPDSSNRDKIANVLKSLDDQIDNNAAIMEELEAMAKTLYDYWFVQFDFPDENGKPYHTSGGEMVWNDRLKREIPKGWKVGNLLKNNLCVPIRAGVDIFEKKIYLPTANVTGEKITDGEYITYKTKESRANMQPVEYSVWFAKMKNSVKHISIPDNAKWFINNYILSTGFEGLACNNKSFPYIHSVVASPYFETKKDTLAHGATQQGVNDDDLQNIKIIEPSLIILAQYANFVGQILRKKFSLMRENHELTKLRDWLLPMLMNGQATVE